jgi:hypothetical protein
LLRQRSNSCSAFVPGLCEDLRGSVRDFLRPLKALS